VKVLSMRRAVLVFVLLIAASIAAEPLIHTHPLSQSSNTPCAVCVGAVARIAAPAPATVAPVAVAFTLTATVLAPVLHRSAAPLPSRAPPEL
jgi:hypothetical protein